MHLPPFGPEPGMLRGGVDSSHILIVLSSEPLTRSLPFGAKATE